MKDVVVVISTYNGSKYIVEQIDSILNQSLSVDKVFIFDDKSTDDTVKVLTKRYGNNNNVEIKENKNNKGWKRNFIEALKTVEANFVFVADQDDIWMSDKVEKMMNIISTNPEVNLLSSNYELYFSEESTNEKLAEDKRLVKDGKLMRYQQVPFSFYVRQPGCTYLIRKSYFDKYWGMWNRDMSHDSFLWKVALFSNSLYSLNEPLIKWRRHSSNESNRRKIKKEDRVKEVKSNLEFICDAKKKFTGEYIEKAYKFCELREKMFDKNSLFFWVLIFINYRGFYVSLRSCFGDLYLLLGLGERL